MDNGLKPPVIALIDDDRVYQFTASKTLQATQKPHKVIQFGNGHDALQFLADSVRTPDQLPDIIFLDINMPVTDGWMFLEEFHKMKDSLTKGITIYMVSSSIDPRDSLRAKNIPEVTAYVEKPISTSKFSELLLCWEEEQPKK